MIAIVVQLLSHVPLFAIPWIAACQTSLSFTISLSLLKPMFVELVMPSNHFIFCHSLLLLCSVFSRIRVFPMSQFFTLGGQSIGPPTSASVLPMNWYDFFAVQGTLESSPAPKFKSINSSVLCILYSPILTFIHDYYGKLWKNHSFD